MSATADERGAGPHPAEAVRRLFADGRGLAREILGGEAPQAHVDRPANPATANPGGAATGGAATGGAATGGGTAAVALPSPAEFRAQVRANGATASDDLILRTLEVLERHVTSQVDALEAQLDFQRERARLDSRRADRAEGRARVGLVVTALSLVVAVVSVVLSAVGT